MSDLWRQSASDIAKLVKTRAVSAVEVTESALARLQAVNPAINAVVAEMPEEALSQAKRIDTAIAEGKDTGILSGVPVTVKVNIDQVGHATTNGLRLQRDLIATIDSPVISNFRKSGAIIIGRTNTPAFSLRWFTRNSVHGHTLNPHNSKITPGGSSGGAAAAVATGIGAIGHGTDIGGSIRYPAYACGVHGLKPTLGRVPAMNFSGPERHIGGQLMAVSGPIARSVADIRLAFEAMVAEDLRDPWWTPVPPFLPLKSRRAALTVNPEGLDVDPEVEQALRDTARKLEDSGWQVVETECPSFRKPALLQARLWLTEMRRNPGIIAEENDADANFVYQQMDRLCPQSDLNDILDAIQSRATLIREWQLFLDEYPVLICPVSAELPFPDQLDVESPAAFERVIEAQLTQVGLPLMGIPGLAVNTGMIDNTPIGIQLVAGRFHENSLLIAAEAIEQAGEIRGPVDPKP